MPAEAAAEGPPLAAPSSPLATPSPPPATPAAAQAVHLVTLGCPKNRVDSEVMLGHLAQAGLAHAESAEAADVIVVNTCGFIDAAREESVDAIVAMAEHKRRRCRTLVVAGCLSQRHGDELARALPEVDHFLGTGNLERIADVLAGRPPAAAAAATPGGRVIVHPRLRGPNRLVPYRHGGPGQAGPLIPDPDFTLNARSPRVASQRPHSRYLKVSEGCSNACAFCIIPRLRGPQRSRPIDDVVAEAERLLAEGARELNLIAQDLCAYGRDLRPQASLADLLLALDDAVDRWGGGAWLRCLYAYPRGLTGRAIAALAAARHVVPYLDMPLQHIQDRLLSEMRRGAGESATRALIARLRREVPGLTLRTTFITGLPGEREDDFRALYDFVGEARFEHLGAFAYSRQEGTPAADMPGQVPPEVGEARRDALMALQQQISRGHQAALVGRRLRVLVDGHSDESPLLAQGRHAGQAPEVDGLTYITDGQVEPGAWVAVQVEQAGDYDVAGPAVA